MIRLISVTNWRPFLLAMVIMVLHWQVESGIQVLVKVIDRLSGSPVDTIIANFTETVVGGGINESKTVEGVYGFATLTFGLGVACSIGFVGSDCNTVCVATNDATGHYECDSVRGVIVCLPGYRNEVSNCTDCVLAEGCCKQV